MASHVGRKIVVKRDGTKIAGVRTTSMTIGNEPIDITTNDSNGFRTLLEESGQKQIDISVEGLLQGDTLIQEAISGTLITSDEIELESGATITGSFRFNNIEVGAEYNNAATFTAEIHSTGTFTFTAA